MTTEIYKDGIPLEEWIEKEVDRRAKTIPVKLFVSGEQIDVIDVHYQPESGTLNVDIDSEIYFSETGKTGFFTKTEPAKMAV